ncbi:terminase small subunit-like protein [Mesorhizobium caraganae]|uniref:terminase small subunit-like protein n=1 Tax=Mesorhizobium caraganae TaxID=483206 RepID=UPI00177A7AC7|nr:helix-turn-helix domain-containing protein [Mesorhizobium caraganae]
MATAGRPTDYKPTYAEEILQLMAEGLSLAAAAAELGFHRQRVYEWEERHPEFADTIKLARSKRQLFLERRLLKADQGPVVTSTIFALKNAAGEDWREKQEVQHDVSDGLADLLREIDGKTRGIPTSA